MSAYGMELLDSVTENSCHVMLGMAIIQIIFTYKMLDDIS